MGFMFVSPGLSNDERGGLVPRLVRSREERADNRNKKETATRGSLGFVEFQSPGKELECDSALEAGVCGSVDDTHAAFAELLENLVMRDCLTD